MTAPVPGWLATLMGAVHSSGLGIERAAPPDARAAAVLVLFGDGPRGPDVLLVQRAADLRRHAGQPAFPGGAVDAGDTDAAAAAVREAAEETGLDPDGVITLGELAPLYIPASGFMVTPVVAWWARRSAVRAVDVAEVAAVASVPLAELADPAHRCRVRYPHTGWVGPGFALAGMLVWGFTAMVLDRLLEVGGWTRPWQPGALRKVSAAVGGRDEGSVGQ